jgi:hypothetical protein
MIDSPTQAGSSAKTDIQRNEDTSPLLLGIFGLEIKLPQFKLNEKKILRPVSRSY